MGKRKKIIIIAAATGIPIIGTILGFLFIADIYYYWGTEVWRFRTGYWECSSPTVADGVVYIGSNDKNFYAVDARTGQEKWRFRTRGDVDSSPTVAEGVVYFGSWDHNLYAVDIATGKEKWRFETGGVEDSSLAMAEISPSEKGEKDN